MKQLIKALIISAALFPFSASAQQSSQNIAVQHWDSNIDIYFGARETDNSGLIDSFCARFKRNGEIDAYQSELDKAKLQGKDRYIYMPSSNDTPSDFGATAARADIFHLMNNLSQMIRRCNGYGGIN